MALLGCVLSTGRLQVSTLFLYIFCLFGMYICFLFRLQVQNVEWFMFLNSRNIIILGFVVILYFIDLSSYQHYFILFLWVYSSLALCFFNFLSGMLSCLFSNLLVHQKIHHKLHAVWAVLHIFPCSVLLFSSHVIYSLTENLFSNHPFSFWISGILLSSFFFLLTSYLTKLEVRGLGSLLLTFIILLEMAKWRFYNSFVLSACIIQNSSIKKKYPSATSFFFS